MGARRHVPRGRDDPPELRQLPIRHRPPGQRQAPEGRSPLQEAVIGGAIPVPVKTSPAGAAALASCCLLLLAASLASVSCRRETEVRGSVFIVTRAADNQKLGLVVVSAIPADRIERFVEEKKARVRAQLERLRKATEARGADV